MLVNSLYLDFAFVRLCDPNGGDAVEIAWGSVWEAFPEWLRRYLSLNGRPSCREIVRDIGSGAQGGSGREILKRYKWVDPDVRGAAYRESGWNSFDENAPPYTPEQVAAERGPLYRNKGLAELPGVPPTRGVF